MRHFVVTPKLFNFFKTQKYQDLYTKKMMFEESQEGSNKNAQDGLSKGKSDPKCIQVTLEQDSYKFPDPMPRNHFEQKHSGNFFQDNDICRAD